MTKLSRSKLELFLECPRCFWLNMNKGIKRPQPPPYTINTCIDYLLKQEFDVHREDGSAHYLIEKYNINAIPYKCKQIDSWRNNFAGIQFQHRETDFLIFGAVDDIWINTKDELIVVDYKATGSNKYKIYDSYKRQMEIYQWLLVKNRYKVSKTGYFLFAKVNKNNGFAKGRLSFDLFLEPCEGNHSWVEGVILSAGKTVDGAKPVPNNNCVYCVFAQGAR